MSSSNTETAALVDVTMPQMGVSVAEGTVAEWRKQEGDRVEADEVIVEISTDKVEAEVPSPATGVVAEILVPVGQTVDVGTLLARIETGDREGVTTAPEPDAAGAPPKPDGAGAPPDGDGHPPPVSPVVRRIADEHGVDPSEVQGTGRRGRVTKKDLLAHLEGVEPSTREPALHSESPYQEEAPPAPPPTPPAPRAAEATAPRAAEAQPAGEPLSVMRKRIGEHMRRSLDTAAHCTTVVEADMSRVDEARGRLSYLPFVCRAAIAALREHPRLNATLEDDRLTVHEAVHLGIAVSLGEAGLIVPVIRDAHELSHEGLAARIRDVAERARAKRLAPEEVAGGTFTITNPGAFGALLATPIINQPQVAILDLEAVVRRPVVVDGDSIAIRPMTYLCMSWDHRALDGAQAATFLSSVRRHLEEWSG